MQRGLENQFEKFEIPSRVVILGGSGFVGGAIAKNLRRRNIEVFVLGRSDIDLIKKNSHKELSKIIKNDDVVVASAAVAPAKNLSDLESNIQIMKNIFEAMQCTPPLHFVNIGSDAVFCDLPLPLVESSSKSPDTFHGIMHLTREIVFAQLDTAVATIRPTLIYGKDDPHNGYGPNRFAKLALAEKKIVLFGEGEERRDHIFIDDVAEIVTLTILYRCVGSLNAVTGFVSSFREIADLVVNHAQSSSQIEGTKRIGNMPHNGLRTFDNTQLVRAFPEFKFTSLSDGIASYFD